MSRSLSSWVLTLSLLGTITYAIAEDLTLTTYYPSPRGVYSELRVQDQVAIGTNTPDQSAALEIAVDPANPRGLLIPRLSPEERALMEANAGGPGSLPAGLMIYNTGTGQYEFIDETGTWPPPVGMWNRTAPDATTDIIFSNPNGKVGIGFDIADPADRPLEQLHITGNFRLPATSAGGGPQIGVIYSDAAPLLHTYGVQNTFLGENAGNFTTTGQGNTAVGEGAMQTLGGGWNNTAVGTQTLGFASPSATPFESVAVGTRALRSVTDGVHNTAVGFAALGAVTTGDANTAVGRSSMASATGSTNVAVGSQTLVSTSGSENTAAGTFALESVTSGSGNSGLGFRALHDTTTGSYNTAVGWRAMEQQTAAVSNNTAVGTNALRNNTADNNTAVGYQALTANTSGSRNTATGYQALAGAVPGTGANNTAVGYQALRGLSSGLYNTAVGYMALTTDATGFQNTAVGANALRSNVGGYDNVAVGLNALYTANSFSNTAVGRNALYATTTGNSNVAVGYQALQGNTIGQWNIAIGSQALISRTNGFRNIAIGGQPMYYTTSGNDNIAIGWHALMGTVGNPGTGSNNIAIGSGALENNSGSGNIAIGSGAGAAGIGNNQLYIGPPGSPLIRGDFSANQLVINGDLTVNGSAFKPGGGTWSVLSDASLKTNVQPLTHALNSLLALRGVSFEWTEPGPYDLPAGSQAGFISQEVEEVFPDWVSTGPDGNKWLTVKGFEALTVEAIRELKKENEELKATNKDLLRRLEALEKRLR